MNIIADCCSGGYLYKDYFKTQYPNPFIWCSILVKDMYELIKNYENIKFNNVKLIRMKDYVPISFFLGDKIKEKHYETLCGLNIDNKFNVYFTHNVYDANAKEPKQIGSEIFYYKNFEYTLQNWEKRIQRFVKENPIFFIITQKNKFGTFEDYVKLLNDFPDANIIMITSDKRLLDFNTKNHRIYFNPMVDRSPEPILKEMYNQIDFNF